MIHALSMMDKSSSAPLPPLLWLVIPLLIVVGQICIELFVPQEYIGALHSEWGPHETLQFVIAAIALVYSFRCLFLLVPQKQPLLIGWVTCFCLGCAYIAGEEISWGQHVFEWGTPEFWSIVNDQNETNLHNTSSWLDQKPRLILMLGVIVGGLIIPFMDRFKPSLLPQKFAIIFPPAVLGVTAALAVATKILDKINKVTPDIILLSRGSEVEELFLFYFVLLYLMVLYKRIKARYAE